MGLDRFKAFVPFSESMSTRDPVIASLLAVPATTPGVIHGLFEVFSAVVTPARYRQRFRSIPNPCAARAADDGARREQQR